MRRLVWLILPCFLVACTALSTGPAPSQTVEGGQMYTLVPGFQATKMFQLTGEVETMTAGVPKNDATITAIMASKYAGGTVMAGTMTAMPTLSLTPTIPSGSPICRARDLRGARDGMMGATQSLLVDFNLTNIGAQACFLPIWSQAILLDQDGKPLDVQYVDSPNSDTPVDPHATLGIPPGRAAWFRLTFWRGSLCMPATVPDISLRVTVGADNYAIVIPTGLKAGPGPECNDSSKSPVEISPYTLP